MEKNDILVNLLGNEYCSGCGACVQICPEKCIVMERHADGFQYPRIIQDNCCYCEECTQVCYLLKKKHQAQGIRRTIVAYHKDYKIRSISSSGGIFFALANYVLGKNGVVFGAAFDKNFQVHQISIHSKDEIPMLLGSKYVQSNTGNSFIETKWELENERIVLYSGTPCQISGLRGYLKKNYKNLFCVSIICHGVPSPDIWQRYLELKKGQYAEKKITKVNFREKTYGWQNFSLNIKFEKRIYSQIFKCDDYMNGFLQNLFLRKSCYHCVAKERIDISDVILGDYWGVAQNHKEMNDDCGISCVVICTKKGEHLWSHVQSEFISTETDYYEILENNMAIEKSMPINKEREIFFQEVNKTGLVEESIRNHLYWNEIPQEIRANIQYPILMNYLRKKIYGKQISTMLKTLNWKNIALYAVTDLMEIIMSDIEKDGNINIQYVCDRNYEVLKNRCQDNVARKLAGPGQLIKSIQTGETDGVIICNPIRENQIISELTNHGLEMKKMISAVSLIFD